MGRQLKQPARRLAALNRIEDYLRAVYPSVFNGYALFAQINKDELKDKFRNWKGSEMSGAESQVINDFYKISRS